MIINQNNFTESEWQYYFIKYPQILNSGFNLFTWKGNGLDINKVQSAGKQPLNSYHSNPYLIALQNLLDKSSTKAELWYGRYSYDMSCIQIEENFQIYGTREVLDSFSIEDYEFPKHLVEEFNLIKEDKWYILQELEKKDRVSIALKFVEKANSLIVTE